MAPKQKIDKSKLKSKTLKSSKFPSCDTTRHSPIHQAPFFPTFSPGGNPNALEHLSSRSLIPQIGTSPLYLHNHKNCQSYDISNPPVLQSLQPWSEGWEERDKICNLGHARLHSSTANVHKHIDSSNETENWKEIDKKEKKKLIQYLSPQIESSRQPECKDNLGSIARKFNNLLDSFRKTSNPPYRLKLLKRPTIEGTLGEVKTVMVNHFKCTEVPIQNLLQYTFDITPKISNKMLRWSIKRAWEEQVVGTYLCNKYLAYNGQDKVYVYEALPFVHKEFVYMHDEKDHNGLSMLPKTYKIKISLDTSQTSETGEVDSKLSGSKFKDFIDNKSDEYPFEFIKALNHVIRQRVKEGDFEKKNYIFKKKGDQLESVRGKYGVIRLYGFFRSLRPTQQGLALNVDMTPLVFYRSERVFKFVCGLLNIKDFEEVKQLNDNDRQIIAKALKGLFVESKHYSTGVSKIHKISGVTDKSSLDIKFISKNNEKISVFDYFKKNYKYQIPHPNFPCLTLHGRNENYMPMELCTILKDQLANDQHQYATTGLVSPCDRIQCVQEYMENTYNKSYDKGDPCVKSFNLSFNTQPTETKARVLPKPKCRTGWELDTEIKIRYWGVLNLSSRKCTEGNARQVMEEIIRTCGRRSRSMEIVKTYQYHHVVNGHNEVTKHMQRIYDKICDSMSDKDKEECNPDLIVILVDGRKQNQYYSEIKYCGDCVFGVPTQVIATEVITNKKLWDGKNAYFNNLFLKIHCRLGGSNVELEDWNNPVYPKNQLPGVMYRSFIAFGADVTHPSDQSADTSSLAAIVASLDMQCSYFGARIRQQRPCEEIITELKSAVTELLKDFQYHNPYDRLPEHILFYRDGVGEFQFNSVLETEFPQIKEGAQAVESGYNPKISLVIVQKRHHTRIFPKSAMLSNSRENIDAGTIVDQKVCHPQQFDFYLCSHKGQQGTSKPTHYHVLYDDANLSVNNIQGITNYLCHIFQRSNQSPVSMPAPAYYAHLAAYRAKLVYAAAKANQRQDTSMAQSSSNEPFPFPPIHENHRSKMFYI